MTGEYAKGRLQLAVDIKQPQVRISMDGDVIDSRNGGLGRSASYAVSARGFSTLRGGIVCASKDGEVEVVAAKMTETWTPG